MEFRWRLLSSVLHDCREFFSICVDIDSARNVLLHVTMPLRCVGINCGCNVGYFFRRECLWRRKLNTWKFVWCVLDQWGGMQLVISTCNFTSTYYMVLRCVKGCSSCQKKATYISDSGQHFFLPSHLPLTFFLSPVFSYIYRFIVACDHIQWHSYTR